MIYPDACTNWNDLAEARQMIAVAKDCGCAMIKFQLFDAEDDRNKPHYQWVKDHELTFEQAKMLFDYGASIGMEVFFSVFGVQYVEWCERIGVKRYKLACGYVHREEHVEVWQAIYKTKKSVIVSFSRSPDGEVPSGIDFKGLYCVPEYPTPFNHITMPNFAETTGWLWDGFSDHTINCDAAKIALARGAQIIECHFILDRNIPSPDAPWSKLPEEIKELVRWEKICQAML